MRTWGVILTTRFMCSMPLPSTCAYPSFRGHCFRSTESAVKLQAPLDFQGNIPTFIRISDGKLHDVKVLDLLIPEPGAFYIMDRGYVDFERLFTLHRTGRFFVIRAKSSTKYRRRYSHPGDESGGVRCDRTIALSGVKPARDYPLPLRRIRYHDVQTSKTFNQTLRRGHADPHQDRCRRCRGVGSVHSAHALQPWQRPNDLALAIRACTRHIAALNKLRTQTKNQLHAVQQSTTTPDVLIASRHQSIAHFGVQIEYLRRQVLDPIAADEALRQSFKLLVSAAGIAAASAIQLLGERLVLPDRHAPSSGLPWPILIHVSTRPAPA